MEKILLEKLVGILTDQVIDLKEKLATEKFMNDYWRKERERLDAQSRENAAIRKELAELKAIVETGRHLTDDADKEESKK